MSMKFERPYLACFSQIYVFIEESEKIGIVIEKSKIEKKNAENLRVDIEGV